MPTALIVGATGLVGTHLVKTLLADPQCNRIVTLGRRKTSFEAPQLEQKILDFEHPEPALFQGDSLFCALGTTRAKAGSKAAFRRVDYDYALTAARLAAEQGVKHFSLVSSVGASARSGTFYLKVKGELEEAVQELGFERLHIFRPSMLLGDRGEFRPMEVIGGALMQAAAPLIGKYAPVAAQKVAEQMVVTAKKPQLTGTHFFASDTIRKGACGE